MARDKKKQKARGTVPPDVMHKYRAALDSLQRGQLAQATATLREVLATRPAFVDARCYLGSALLEQSRLDEAEPELREVLRTNPRHAGANRAMGNLCYYGRRLEEALEFYDRALETVPDDGNALNNKATVLQECHRLEEAIAVYREAIRLHPQEASAHNNLANTYRLLGRHAEAEAEYAAAVALHPGYGDAYSNWGALLEEEGRLEEARERHEQALALHPSSAEVHNNLASVLLKQARIAEARDHLQCAVRLAPGLVEAHFNLGLACKQGGDLRSAAGHYARALELSPLYLKAQANLAGVLEDLGEVAQALHLYDAALRHRPDEPRLRLNLGSLHARQGRYDEAVDQYRAALALDDSQATLHLHLANALRGRAQLEEAVASYERAVALDATLAEAWADWGSALVERGHVREGMEKLRHAHALAPSDARIHSNLIFALDLDPESTPSSLLQERRRFQESQAALLEPTETATACHANPRVPERRLRVGYVSADFCSHSAAQVTLPLLRAHDRSQIDVFCYSSTHRTDDVTRQFREAALEWRQVLGLPDDVVANVVRKDGIDILVDLGGHTAGNRLTLFMRRPAPIQVTAWGYANGTGLDAMDALLTDAVTVRPDEHGCFAEKIVYLPCAFVYQPPDAIPLAPLPMEARGHITFGSLNRMAKIHEDVLATWARLLQQIPGARLLLKDRALDDPAARQKIEALFSRLGVARERLTMLGASSRQEHLAAYQLVDLALDPFPQTGGVTTLEALWMGVPVVTLSGRIANSRSSATLLTQVGASDFVARDADEYVSVAIRQARDVARLRDLRAGLRAALQASPVLEHHAYCRAVEDTYRTLWRAWCSSAS